ncbi:carbohydrate ABC transporter permease [Actinomadura sp. LOL_016]|uniref:carbohydrate ABC transporter permease n=1 Tax=unclassified Actinomadura TaxID=2626254 RepID=UPI003A7FD20D
MRSRILAALLAAAVTSVLAGCGGDGDGGADTSPLGADTEVTITVGCMPAKSQDAQRKEWNEDIAAFQKLHPNIKVVGKDANLLNTPWAIWLPAAANAFNIFLLKRFFDSIPTELIDAVEVDGAAPARILWSIVLPVSRPIIGVVSIFTIVNVWRDCVWPLLVLPDGEKKTISVAISSLAVQVPQNVLIGSLVIASLPTIAVFFVFQRQIMAGLTAGGLKG